MPSEVVGDTTLGAGNAAARQRGSGHLAGVDKVPDTVLGSLSSLKTRRGSQW